MPCALHAPPPTSQAGWAGAALPGVWRASELGGAALHTLSSGHPALDQALPGGGWPRASLTELLQAQPGLHEWRLLLPALRVAVQTGPLVLIAPPHLPNLAALACQGIAAALVLRVEAHTPAERLWAAEQALRCRELGALLAWLPQARPEQLRRLHLSAQSTAPTATPPTTHRPSQTAPTTPLVFVFRPLAAQHESSPAPLRLALRGLGREGLELNLIKRRGPALDRPLRVAAAYPVVAALGLLPESSPRHDARPTTTYRHGPVASTNNGAFEPGATLPALSRGASPTLVILSSTGDPRSSTVWCMDSRSPVVAGDKLRGNDKWGHGNDE